MPISPSTPHYPLAILGPGALGLHFAAGLNEHFPVALIARDEAAAARLRAGVDVGERRIRFDAFAPDATPTADWVIVLVKAGDTGDAARTAARLARRGVLSLQNGLVEDLLCAACADLPCGQGITTAGAFRDGERVTPVARGETLLPPRFEALAQMLAEGGFPARVEPDIDAARLAKLLVNVAINPLTAIFRVRNGELLQPPHSIYLDALAREAWPVLHAEGLAMDEAAALARVREVAAATAQNRASMLQDVLAGRRTEIDAITGALLAMARRQGRAVPTHEAVYRLVKLLDAG